MKMLIFGLRTLNHDNHIYTIYYLVTLHSQCLWCFCKFPFISYGDQISNASREDLLYNLINSTPVIKPPHFPWNLFLAILFVELRKSVLSKNFVVAGACGFRYSTKLSSMLCWYKIWRLHIILFSLNFLILSSVLKSSDKTMVAHCFGLRHRIGKNATHFICGFWVWP